jgi:hypothetical protein
MHGTTNLKGEKQPTKRRNKENMTSVEEGITTEEVAEVGRIQGAERGLSDVRLALAQFFEEVLDDYQVDIAADSECPSFDDGEKEDPLRDTFEAAFKDAYVVAVRECEQYVAAGIARKPERGTTTGSYFGVDPDEIDPI